MNNCCSPLWLNFFKAASDLHRQKIINLIKKHKSINASDIVKSIKLSQPTISHHLKILTNAQLITSKKRGKETFYSINNKIVADCCLGFMHKINKPSK